jgi:tetratricopeptide (TPR) repeat protein
MAEPAPAGGYTPKMKRESAGSALVQVVLVGAIVAGGVFFYAKTQSEKKRVMDLAVKAKEATGADDAPALLKAQRLFLDIGSEDKLTSDNAILASLAELEAQLYQAYGVKESKDKAQRYVEMLKQRESRSAERFAAEAYLLLGDGRANEAEALLMDLVNNRGARHAKLLHALSVAKLQQGKAKEAVVAAQEGQKLSTALVRLPIAEGDALYAVGNVPSAFNAYLKAKKLNPDHMRARTALTLLAAITRQGKPAELLKELDRQIEETKTHPDYGGNPPPRVRGFIEYAKGEVYLVENNAKEALAMADASLATDPGQPGTQALRGRALAKLGKIEDAKKAFDDALALSPSSLPIAKAAFEVLARAGKGADGMRYLEKVREANPENGMVYVELSLAQSSLGKGKDALASADKAIEKLGNAHDLAVFAKGRALQADNQLDKARETYAEAVGFRASQDWPELYFALGELRMAEKNYDDAVVSFQEAIKFWDKQGGSVDYVADAWEKIGKAYEAQGKKMKRQADEAFDKAKAIRKGNKA